MKEWAKEFYHSKAWQHTRAAYLQAQHKICERCGEPAKIVHHKVWLTKKNINNNELTLSLDNLEALCQDCHNKEHHRGNTVVSRYAFDSDGNVTPPMQRKKSLLP